ncbi:MAG: DNA-binding protein Alba [Candidatus Bathyarchaeia archaeon]
MPQTPEKNVILVGKKPTMSYVVACLTLFNTGAPEVVVRARGRAISNAVDTVELLRRAFVKDLEIKEITIGTQELSRYGGGRSGVSTIDIVCSKPKKI